MQQNKKNQIISSIPSEDELRVDLIIPLFRKMGYETVDNQGPNEFGTDVILRSKNKLGTIEYTSIVLKKGDINNKSGDPSGILKVLRDQVEQAFTMPLDHPEIKKNTFPNLVLLITNGKISNNAKSVFDKLLRSQFKSLVNIEYLDVNELVVHVDKHWPEFYLDRRPFLSQYAEYLRNQLLDINISDIADTSKKIEDVLIPQLLIEKKNIDELGNKKLNIKRLPLTPIQLLSNKKDFLFITGEAGAGKSTLLKRLAIDIAEKEENIPIIISAKEIAKAAFDVNNIYKNVTLKDNSIPEADIINELRESKIILLVDGLDEIRDPLIRSNTLKSLLELQQEKNNIIKTIISTRPESNTEILSISKPITTFQVQPVQNTQVTKFFSKWFGNNQKSKASKLLRELTSKSILDKLPKTPLTLTLLAIVYETRNDLPTTLTELYRIFIELLLGKLDHKKGINSIKDSQVKSGLLSHIAWEMHHRGLGEISQKELLIYASNYLKNQLGDEESDPEEIVQSIIDRSALLVPSGNKIKFRHLSFQEYFSARSIYTKKVFRDCLSEWVEDPWWTDVLFFAAGSLKNIDDYVELLKSDKQEDILTSVYCIGGMLQAAYETSTTNKQELINYAKNRIPKILSEIREDINKRTDNKLPSFIPYAVLIDLLTDNYSSTYLNSALEKELQDLNSGDDDNALKNFFIAASMAKSNNIKGLEEIITSPEINNPVIMLLSDIMLDEYDEKFNNGKESVIHKKVKKKIQKNSTAVLSLISLKKS